jgi:thioredoxin reductase (NADPH)
MKKVIIIGSGPAGLTAGIYVTRAGFPATVIAGVPGGQLINTTKVENFPGFPQGISGIDLMDRMTEQAKRFGVEVLYENAVSANLDTKEVTFDNGSVLQGESIIIATGSQYKRLGVEGEKEFAARGVSYCATCDGAFFRGKEVAVVGGGDTAMEDALFLSNLCQKVYLIHRRREFRASHFMQQKVLQRENIEFLLEKTVAKITGEKLMNGVNLRDTVTGNLSYLSVDGLFVAIGAVPKTELFAGQLPLDEQGYIVLRDGKSSKTDLPGVFACGDCTDPTYKQAVIAAAAGAVAGIDASAFLTDQE